MFIYNEQKNHKIIRDYFVSDEYIKYIFCCKHLDNRYFDFSNIWLADVFYYYIFLYECTRFSNFSNKCLPKKFESKFMYKSKFLKLTSKSKLL